MRILFFTQELLVAILITFLFWACKADTQKSQLNLIGGYPVTMDDYPNTIALTNAAGEIYCSGTAISKRLVITAAHCVATRMPAEEKIRIHVGEGSPTRKVAPGTLYTISSAGINPKYSGAVMEGFDIAYLVTAEDLPLVESDFVRPLVDYDEITEALQAGHPITLVGFGAQSKKLPPEGGTKCALDTKINEVLDLLVSIGDENAGGFTGDSGGPAFVQLRNSEWRLVGVTSGGGFIGAGFWGLLHENICWVQKDSKFVIPGADLHCYDDTIPFDKTVFEAESFNQSCSFPQNQFLARTYEVLKQVTDSPNCLVAESRLRAMNEINLDNKFLVDISPLAYFNNIEKISLVGNKKASLKPLQVLPNLKTLGVDLSRFANLDELKTLLSHNPTLNISVSNPEKEVFKAIETDSMFKFTLAISNVRDLEFGNEKNETPLLSAVWNNRLEMVKELLDRGANINVVTPIRKQSALMFAVYANSLPIAKLLIARGIDLSLRNVFGRTALEEAKSGNGRQIAEYIESISRLEDSSNGLAIERKI